MLPLLSPESNRFVSQYDLYISPEGTLSAEGGLTLTGLPAYSVEAILNSSAPVKHDKILKTILLKDVKGVDAEIKSVERNGDKVSILGSIDNVGKVKRVGEEMYVELNPMPALTNYKFDNKDRTEPGSIEHNLLSDNSLTLHIPEGYVVGELPADVAVSNKYFDGKVTSTVSDDGRTITRTVVVVTRRGIVPLDQVKSYNSDVMRLVNSCTASVILRQGN
ncbi:MAG: hypothetical protein K2J17_00705 [Paramuribaculum sp.]|nr:hypothetical protein [Paramuribaculum sp.]